MAKNDYRRALIMLRGLEKGYSGHARLEKRVLSGSMDFVTGTPEADETLSAAFVGNRGNKTLAQAVGILKNDGRGQRALLAHFDPRNIRGMDLSDITAAVISRLEPNGAQPVLFGYINGAKELDWQKIRAALDEIYLPKEEPAPVFEEKTPEQTEIQKDVFEEPVPMALEAETVSASNQAESAFTPAGSRLSLDMSKPWPEDIESLRLLFLTLPAYEPFPKEDYVFVKAGMAEETNIDHCAVGVRAENGRVAGVCYAIPMPYTAQPPAGLEGYEWVGNTQSGWWVTCDDVP